MKRIEGQDVDLISRENERIRARILRVATKEFRDQGYQQARVSDIIRKAGVSSQVFYRFFPSKAELLVESFRTILTWSVTAIEPELRRQADAGERVLRRTLAGDWLRQFGSSVLALISAEAPNGDRVDLARRAERAWAPIMKAIEHELQHGLKQGAAAPVSLELIAYSLLGALHYSSMRASWGDKFNREDVLAAHLWLFLVVLDALGRQTDPDPYISRYKDLIKQMALGELERPPVPEE